ncbi:MAG TPA: DUF3105 domain-containing protein [Chloroflexota bacterium]|nr:DUF3105 domain-containing protein [Chloroflexota bacterium]
MRPPSPVSLLIGLATLALSVACAPFGGGGKAAAGPPAAVETFTVASANHTAGAVTYTQTPPVGGDHAPQWFNCGYYGVPVITEAAVHSMEHGAVWITYSPDLARDQVEILRRLGQSQRYVLVSPYPGLTSPVVASAWGKQARMRSASDPALDRFVRDFAAGPQTPEPGAPCSGGIGTPQ